jgi:opacity protein-like surface antigen
MKRMLGIAVLALAISAPAALAQTANPGVSTAPSAPNSGAGIAGQPGNKNGPAARPGETVGSAAGANRQNSTDRLQDTSNIKGLPGNKSGSSAKEPDRK